MSKVIVIISPYSASGDDAWKVIENRIRFVSEYFAKLIGQGDVPIAPVLMGHQASKFVGDLDTSWNYWSDYCKKLIADCDEVHAIRSQGFTESAGVQSEMIEAALQSKPIKFIDLPDYEEFRFNPKRIAADLGVNSSEKSND